MGLQLISWHLRVTSDFGKGGLILFLGTFSTESRSLFHSKGFCAKYNVPSIWEDSAQNGAFFATLPAGPKTPHIDLAIFKGRPGVGTAPGPGSVGSHRGF